MSEKRKGESRSVAVARYVAEKAGPVERLALMRWAETLLAIQQSKAPIHRKAQNAMNVTLRSEVIPAILKLYGAPLKRLAWDDRSWPARVGGVAAAATVGLASSEGAGIAALGGAIGVPLWIVIGAGSTFATVLLQELADAVKRDEARPSTTIEDIPLADFMILPANTTALPHARNELRAEWQNIKAALPLIDKDRSMGRFNRIRLRASAAINGIRQCAEEHIPMKKSVYVGVDGCSAGWFSVAIDTTGRSWISVDTSFADLLERWPKAANILVDIPVGLPGSSDERNCDVASRAVLHGRRSSVFPAPARETLAAPDYRSASAINKEITGRGLSKQAWNICDKIREVDVALSENKKLIDRVIEVHPELLFWALNNRQPLEHYKKTPEGEKERLSILQRYLPTVDELYTNARSVYSRAIVAPDDILDALAAAVTGVLGQGKYSSLPDPPQVDAKKIPMAMWYVVPGEMMPWRTCPECGATDVLLRGKLTAAVRQVTRHRAQCLKCGAHIPALDEIDKAFRRAIIEETALLDP